MVHFFISDLLEHNTTIGPYRKLGRLYGSCLRQKINSTTISNILHQLGGYLPIGALGPSNLSSLVGKIYEMGPTPLFDIYYDLSSNRRRQMLLIISGPSTSAPILEGKLRWMGPRAPFYKIKDTVPKLLSELLDSFLPAGLSYDHKMSEKETITTFIAEFNKVRIENTKKGFWNSSLIPNVTLLQEHHPFVSLL